MPERVGTCMCLYVCESIYTHVYEYVHKHMHECACVCVMCACVCNRVCEYAHITVCVTACACVCAHRPMDASRRAALKDGVNLPFPDILCLWISPHLRSDLESPRCPSPLAALQLWEHPTLGVPSSWGLPGTRHRRAPVHGARVIGTPEWRPQARSRQARPRSPTLGLGSHERAHRLWPLPCHQCLAGGDQ